MGSCCPVVLPLPSLGGFPVSVNNFFTKLYALDQALIGGENAVEEKSTDLWKAPPQGTLVITCL
jgi:hypothetical protein